MLDMLRRQMTVNKNPCLFIKSRIISTFASQFMPTQEGRMEKGHAPGWAASFNLKAKEYPFYQEKVYPTNLLTLQNKTTCNTLPI